MNNERPSAKKLNIFLGIGMIALYVLFCFCLVPLWRMLASDVAYMDTVLPDVVEFLFDVTELCAISLGYAVSVYIIYRFGVSGSAVSAAIFGCATLFKYAANLVMSWADAGFIIRSVTNDIWSSIIPLLLELLQYFIVIRLAISAFGDRLDAVKKHNRLSKKLGYDEADYDKGIYPFKSMFDLENPMLRTAFRAAVVVVVTKVLSRIVFDIMLTLAEGLPSLEEIPLMLVYYVSDAIPGVICYFVIILVLMGIFSYGQKKKQ